MQRSNRGLSSEVEQNNYLISFMRDILINVTQCWAFALFCHSVALLIHIQIISHCKSSLFSLSPCANTGYSSAAKGSRQELLCAKKRCAMLTLKQTASFCTHMWLLVPQTDRILGISQLWVPSNWYFNICHISWEWRVSLPFSVHNLQKI